MFIEEHTLPELCLRRLCPSSLAPWAVPPPGVPIPGTSSPLPWEIISFSITKYPLSDLFPTRRRPSWCKDCSHGVSHPGSNTAGRGTFSSTPQCPPHSSSPPHLAQKDSKGFFWGGLMIKKSALQCFMHASVMLK